MCAFHALFWAGSPNSEVTLPAFAVPATYVYLFFYKYRSACLKLRRQELDYACQEKLIGSFRIADNDEKLPAVIAAISTAHVEPSDVLPGFMLKITEGKGYEWRTYWFELFEMVRKVLLVGVPAIFTDRGGTLQLFWGLLVCFATFGMYMMYAPFVEDSDDTLQQMAQAQIFLTLISSLALRAVPPSAEMEYLLSTVLMAVPLIGIYLSTPLGEELSKCLNWVSSRCIPFTKSRLPPRMSSNSKVMPAAPPTAWPANSSN